MIPLYPQSSIAVPGTVSWKDLVASFITAANLRYPALLCWLGSYVEYPKQHSTRSKSDWSISQPHNSWLDHLVGGFNPSKNISQIGSSFQLLGKIKNVPNHQPVSISVFPKARKTIWKTIWTTMENLALSTFVTFLTTGNLFPALSGSRSRSWG